ncbi:hypothetical protein C8Q74DRAFT_329226 [Fomes fomentarius]|nr:hypothetical protein C8Q74DRAFT_329226 [Fomes fomentarius]
MLTMPTILQDVVDYTFSFLADSPHELSTCALVCRDWLPGSHSVLFSSITLPIRTGRASDRWIPLEAILEKNPSLAIYVRSLTLKGDHEDITHVKWRGYRTFELHWLPNLRSLTLDRFWFTNIDHVHSIIASAPLLDNLVLDHIQWVSPPHEGPRVPRPQICLQDSSAIANAPRYTHSLKQFSFTADVYVTHRSFHDPILRLGHSLLSAGMIHALQSLELYGASQCESWEPVLRIIGPSLHHLGIGIYEDKEDDLDPSKTVAERKVMYLHRILVGLMNYHQNNKSVASMTGCAHAQTCTHSQMSYVPMYPLTKLQITFTSRRTSTTQLQASPPHHASPPSFWSRSEIFLTPPVLVLGRFRRWST